MTGPLTRQLSSNEIEQLCQKAARGAGLSWGLAEEAGMAAAWLSRHGIDGPSLLNQRLHLGPLAGPMIPWERQSRLQCPITLGAALSDHSDLAPTSLQGRVLDLGLVAVPVLLLPFIAQLACRKGHTVEVTTSGAAIFLSASGAVDLGDNQKAGSALLPQARVSISAATQTARNPPPRTEPPPVPIPTIASLDHFAMATTVPASALSRAGAGAAVGDDD